MEWAQGIELRNGSLVSRVAGAGGAGEWVRLDELSSRGLPVARSTLRSLKGVSLSQLHAIDSADYLEAFGLQSLHGDRPGHQVYQLQTDRRRWVIPALALIRGLVRPNSLLLDEVFRPQMLERVSVFAPESPSRVKIIASWSQRIGGDASDPSNLLYWLWRDSNARGLVGSIHQHAMHGSIGFQPSDVAVDLAVKGLRRGSDFYVTRCTVTKAYLRDIAAEDSSGRVEVIELVGHGAFKNQFEQQRGNAELVARRPDGTIETTDEEWVAVLPILRKDTRGKAPRVDLRRVWDVMLRELAGGGVEARAQEEQDVQDSLAHYRRKWRNQRSLVEAIAVLNALRATE